jgi:serine/threonine-protein kinase RsbW
VNPLPVAEEVYGRVDVNIPAKAEWVAVARLTVAAVASRLQFSVEDIEDVKLAIAEACTNSIQHGAPSDTIAIACEVSGEELRITVRDQGQGVRLESVVETGFKEDGRTEELGVFLIRALMDSVEYRVDAREGTELVMTKRVLA